MIAEYAFTEREQAILRILGKLGFCYERETKKVIDLKNHTNGRFVSINRERFGSVGIVLSWDPNLSGVRLDGVTLNPKASSNQINHHLGVTKNGKVNYIGLQAAFDRMDSIESFFRLKEVMA